jgi:hypothetical protein
MFIHSPIHSACAGCTEVSNNPLLILTDFVISESAEEKDIDKKPKCTLGVSMWDN